MSAVGRIELGSARQSFGFSASKLSREGRSKRLKSRCMSNDIIFI